MLLCKVSHCTAMSMSVSARGMHSRRRFASSLCLFSNPQKPLSNGMEGYLWLCLCTQLLLWRQLSSANKWHITLGVWYQHISYMATTVVIIIIFFNSFHIAALNSVLLILFAAGMKILQSYGKSCTCHIYLLVETSVSWKRWVYAKLTFMTVCGSK